MSLVIRPRRIGAALGCLFFFACALSCADVPSEVHAPTRPVVPYAGHAADLFDDGIEPATVGYSASDVAEPNADQLRRERLQEADTVVRARIVTLTSQESEQGWLVGLRPLETLAGVAPTGDVLLQVSATDRAVGVLRAYEDRIVGMTVVAFLRAFAHERDTRGLHFHIAADTPSELHAIRSAALLEEVH